MAYIYPDWYIKRNNGVITEVSWHLHLTNVMERFVAHILKFFQYSSNKSFATMRLFKPRQFGDNRSLFSLATMSMSYWDLAEDFKNRAIQDIDSGKTAFYSVYVFPSIIMYCSAIEALINENLALLGSQTKDTAFLDDINSLRRGLNSYREIPIRIRRAFDILKRTNQTPIDAEILQDFLALSELRNAIIHYCPDYIDVLQWPHRLKQALERSKVKPVEADWTVTFRSKEVLLWAYETSRTLISVFLRARNDDEARFFNE